jgi:ABC-2 type transport system permease protein
MTTESPVFESPVSEFAPGADHGNQIKGPSALGNDWRRLLRLTYTLAVTDFKLRFFGSALGYLWQLMRPLLMFGILYLVFSVFLDFNGNVRFYSVGLLTGIVLFTFLGDATSGAVKSIVNRENLVRKIEFPRLAVPMAQVLMGVFNLGLNLLPVFGFYIASGGRPRWEWLELPVIVLVFVMFTSGLAMLLSSLYVRARDVDPIWDVVMQAMFYATPIFYTLDVVREKTHGNAVPQILISNPFAAILQQFRHAMLDPSWETPAHVYGSPWLLAVPLGVVVLVLVVGSWVFAHEAPLIAEEL